MGGAFSFEPVGERHLAMLREWLQRPHVAQWWGPAGSLRELREDYVTSARENGVRAYIAHREDEPVGFIQAYVVMGAGGGWWQEESDPGARGVDQFLANASDLGRGIGTAMLREFLRRLFDDPAVTVVQTDPNPSNGRAIRSYEKAGFCAIGLVTTPDGPARLMRRERSDPSV